MHIMNIAILFPLKIVLYYTEICDIIRLDAILRRADEEKSGISVKVLYGNDRDPSHGGGRL